MKEQNEFLFINLMEHLFFGFVALFEMVVNHIAFSRANFLFILAVALVYLIVNFLVYEISGDEVYPEMSWNNWATVGYVLIGIFIGLVGYMLGYYFTEKVKSPKKIK